MRAMGPSQVRPAHQVPHARQQDGRTRSERLADKVTSVFGSWKFIIIQTMIVCLWISLNLLAVVHHWDPYPFILLNLVFSTQAAYAAPLILLSQNRQADTDRVRAEHDYRVNQIALRYLEVLHRDAHGPDCDCGDLTDLDSPEIGADESPMAADSRGTPLLRQEDRAPGRRGHRPVSGDPAH